ncbi:putative membrane protein [Treponema primitia ZAS-2]|uniref:Putative membrane protein n=1 Tax=Treponema primitia (strain ATCC BAA-887 / DSM 12427 / ZAS-2) TaxID=545694 RepID=F5YNZ1_TREPZ|nr:O-antigen polymerase [Treponema primitia]AEF83710.1 putative membrane protein [Treponema primitia ZAS-2]
MEDNSILENKEIKLISKLIIFVLFFLYLYPLKFIFFSGISTRLFIGGIGFILFATKRLTTLPSKIFIVKKEWAVISFLLCFILVISLLTNMINRTSETQFTTYPISMIMIFFAAYFISTILKLNYGCIKFELIANYIVICIFMQMIFAILIIIFPSFRGIVNMLSDESGGIHFIKNDILLRVIGLSSHSFGAGVINSFGLLLISLMIKQYALKWNEYLYLIFGFFLVSIVGCMMSRTTVVGILLSFFILIHKSLILKFRFTKKFRSGLKSIVFIIIFGTILLFILFNDIIMNLETFFRYGFEFLYNLSEKGDLSSASTDQLIDMYKTIPSEIKTWIIGDGYWADPLGDGYYMHTDVGYMRSIFYYGLIGTLIYYAYEMALIWFADRKTNKEFQLFFAISAILLLICSLKGFTNFTSFVAVFLFCKKDNICNLHNR